MAIHRKAAHRVLRKRVRKAKRHRMRLRGLNPDDFFSGGFYVGARKEKE